MLKPERFDATHIVNSICGVLSLFCLAPTLGCGSNPQPVESGASPSVERAVPSDSSAAAENIIAKVDEPAAKETANDSPAGLKEQGDNTSGGSASSKEPLSDQSKAPSNAPGLSPKVPSFDGPSPPVAKPAVTEPAEVKPPQTTTNKNPAELLEAEIAAFQMPPDWLADVRPAWDVSKPWKEGRIEIRRLLGADVEKSRREGIKLTWEYLQKKDMGDGHEYGMYMFLGNEPLWAIIAFREYVNRTDLSYPPYFGLKALASLYAQRGMFDEAEEMLSRGLKMSPPKREWKEMRTAEMHDAFGDLFVAWGKHDKAREHFETAIKLFPQAKPPYGRHLLPRRAKQVQLKVDLISMRAFSSTKFPDGVYRETALGYSGDVKLSIEVQGGRVADIRIQHQEKIDQNACTIIPQRIVEKQSLQVDGISGATVTKNAIVTGTLRALQRIGLK